MTFNDVVNPARANTTNAKHGGGVVLTPGVNIDQTIDAGVTKPVSISETKLTNRFDDTLYYNNTLTGNLEFYSNAEWIVPNGVTQITVKAFGQGGYGQTATGGNAGHGGGGGAYAQSTFSVTPGTMYSITLNTGAVGGDGGNTKLRRNGTTTVLLAEGGKSGANGGAGGNILNCVGDTVYSGGDGADPSGFGGGGGGASSDISTGNYASNGTQEGAAGTGNGASGGNGGAQFGGNQSNGFPGGTPGGGGGGGSYDIIGQINYTGGAGGLGKLTIVW